MINLLDKPAVSRDSETPLAGNYFVSAYPPFSCWQALNGTEPGRLIDNLSVSTKTEPLGLYIHIPFCTVRCSYCYYLSYPHRSEAEIDKYVDTLIREIEIYSQMNDLTDRKVNFVYFGGGTPSLLSGKQIGVLLDGLKKRFPWTEVQEVSFECSPKTLTETKLKTLRQGGVTRISLGIQQLNDAVLKKNGRVHLIQDVERAYEMINRVGFDAVNVDLMVGLIGESERTFWDSLQRVIGMNPDSVTIYQLEMPKNTPLYRLYDGGRLDAAPCSWPVKRSRLAKGFARLEVAGYRLRSAYTAGRTPSGMQFLYQDAQYHGADLLGIGVSAFSYLAGIHYQNKTSLKSYIQKLDEGQLPIERFHVLSDAERLVREFVLQLKLGEVSRQYFKNKFHVDICKLFLKSINSFVGLGLLVKDGDRLSLTRDGLLQVDEILPEFYLAEHRGIRYS
ncbi:MAG: coproporphyrinogen-III oxidase family protein [bacterium]